MCSKFEGGDVVQVVKAPPVCQTCKILLFHLKTVGGVVGAYAESFGRH